MSSPNGHVFGVLSFAIQPVYDGDCIGLFQSLATFVRENPTLISEASLSEETFVIKGDDELHLRNAQQEILQNFQVRTGELKIEFRETIRRTAEAEGKYVRQAVGLGDYGHVKIRLEPREPGAGFTFVDEIKGRVVPQTYVGPIEHGVREALKGGILAGCEMVDLKAVLYDGSYHEVASNEMAFKIAASLAFKEAARKASPVLLEPIMAIEVTARDEQIGTILSDIHSRRGRIDDMERAGDSQRIKALVPLAEVLRSSTYGRPEYPMRFARYEPAPPRADPFGDDAAAYAKKPWTPKPGAGSTTAKQTEL